MVLKSLEEIWALGKKEVAYLGTSQVTVTSSEEPAIPVFVRENSLQRIHDRYKA